jgi:3-isopropylmalate/(R)-2-methylmalate dehydratase small subunit
MERDPFTILRSRAFPLMMPNVDTDVIIRVERMMTIDRTELARSAFESIRYDPDGSPKPDFVFNDPKFAGAQILLAGDNFGCGSSREPAVWAIAALGIRCIIAPSFGDIFAANCFVNGVLPVSASIEAVEQLGEFSRRCGEITVDLPAQQIRFGAEIVRFEVGAVQKIMLVEGIDEMTLALRHRPSVERWESQDRRARPWIWPQQ